MNKKITLFLIIAVLWIDTTFKFIQTVPGHGILAQWVTLFIFALMSSWLIISHAHPNTVNKAWFQILAWPSSLLMGYWATFILLALPIDLGLFVYRACHYFINTDNESLNMAFVAQRVNYILLIITTVFILLGLLSALREPRIKHVSIAMAHLPLELDHFKIAQISDLHVGPTIRQNYVRKVVQRVNAATPHLIAVTGDLADAKPETIHRHLHPLAELKASAGAYYVTGNHEYYWGIHDWIKKAGELGLQPLINEHQMINWNGNNLMVAGITDHIGGQFAPSHQPDLKKAVSSATDADFKILLAHRPDVYLQAEQLGFDLQLSGHTHAGQFFPFNLLLPFVYKYYQRLHRHGALWLYVNPGTGYWGPANRFGVPAEITLITLVRK